MPNTTNFNFPTPADTDLVKDGASAIRSLGNSIDTAFVDLKGGTTGQILSKASNTDLDYTWIANDQGDITEVQAGTGISVASGTGPIPVVTNTVATTFDAKGDLVAGTGADTFAKLTVGANNTVLTADSTTATGLKWATPAASSFVGCMAVASANVTVANATDTAVAFGGTDLYDTDGFHDPASNNSRITIPSGKGGKYLFQTMIRWDGNSTGVRSIKFYINGTEGQTIYRAPAFSGSVINTVSFMLNLVATDYVQIYVNQTSGISIELDYSGSSSQLGAGLRFGCQYLGA